MPLQTLDSFSFNHSDQPDKLYEIKTASQVKDALDSRGEELQTKFNSAINVLKSTTAGDSGAENIGSSSISGLIGNTVHEQILQIYNVAKQAQTGTLIDGIITDPKLSDDPSQIKARFTSHKAESASLTQASHVQLQTTIDTSESKALTPKALNNHQIDYTKHSGYAVTSGTSTAYTITLTPAPTAYSDGQQFIILPHVDCGAVPTLNVNGLGALSIVKQDGSAISVGDIKMNKPLSLVRVGSNFFICSFSGSNIKSIQRGKATLSSLAELNITISSVDVTKSIVMLSAYSTSNNTLNACFAGEITTSTNLNIKRNASASDTSIVSWQVIEFNNVRSLQSGMRAIQNTETQPISIVIGSVNTSKAIVVYSCYSDKTPTYSSDIQVNVSLLNSTTLTAQTQTYYAGYMYLKWQVIEFN